MGSFQKGRHITVQLVPFGSSHHGTCLYATGNDDKKGDLAENFDAQGFGGYLAPYAAALIASVLVTGAFIKFVLLDY